MTVFQCLAAAFLTLVIASTAAAQGVTTLVVPYPAGGPSDFVARTVQPELQRALGRSVVIDNVGGASGALGIQKVVGGPADGSALVLATPMELVLAPLALQAVRHKPEDLRPVGVMVSTVLVLAARKDLAANTLDELLAGQRQAGAKPLSYASAGVGTLYHLAGAVFAQQAGLALTHVPYKGVAPMVTDLLGGQVDMAFLPLAGNLPAMIREGKLKAYGVTARQPYALLPSLPALAASKGFERLVFDIWAGLFVSAKVPDAAVATLHAALEQAVHNPAVRKAFESTGNVVAPPRSVSGLNAFYADEIARYQIIAKEAHVQAE